MDILGINQPYLNTPAFRDVFAAAGHRMLTVDWYPEGGDIIPKEPVLMLGELFDLLPRDFKPDRIIYFDRSEPLRIIGFEDSPVPTLIHLVDTHIHRDWHHIWSGAFDFCLLAMRSYINRFQMASYFAPTRWFPLWAFRIGPPPEAPRHTSVSFRGSFGPTHTKRPDFFAGVNARTPVDFGSGPFFDVYADSKIILNDCISDDLNWRVFEALASGALLLTPRVSPETLDLFPEGTALATYRAHDVDDAAEKIDYYLTNENERLRIASEGYTRTLNHHTAKHRAQMLLTNIEGIQKRPLEHKLFCAAAAYLKTMAIFPWFFQNRFATAAFESIRRLSGISPASQSTRDEQMMILRSLLGDVETTSSSSAS